MMSLKFDDTKNNVAIDGSYINHFLLNWFTFLILYNNYDTINADTGIYELINLRVFTKSIKNAFINVKQRRT